MVRFSGSDQASQWCAVRDLFEHQVPRELRREPHDLQRLAHNGTVRMTVPNAESSKPLAWGYLPGTATAGGPGTEFWRCYLPGTATAGLRYGLTPRGDVGLEAGFSHLGLNTRLLLFGGRHSSSLIWTGDVRLGTLDLVGLAPPRTSGGRGPARRLRLRENYDLTSRLLMFVPAAANTSVLLGAGVSAGRFWHLGKAVVDQTTAICDPGDYAAECQHSKDSRKGYYSVYVRELVLHVLFGVEFSDLVDTVRKDHVLHAGLIANLASERNPEYGYETERGILVAYSGTFSLLGSGVQRGVE